MTIHRISIYPNGFVIKKKNKENVSVIHNRKMAFIIKQQYGETLLCTYILNNKYNCSNVLRDKYKIKLMKSI